MAKTGYETVKEWRKANPDKVAAQARRYRAKHPDNIKTIKDRYRDNGGREIDTEGARRRRLNNPEAQRLRNQRYVERQRQLKIELAGRPPSSYCEACHDTGPVVWDHCHRTNEFRGWICDRCNKTLGMVKDDPELLVRLAFYLEPHHGSTVSEAS